MVLPRRRRRPPGRGHPPLRRRPRRDGRRPPHLGESGTAARTRCPGRPHLEDHGGWIVLDGDPRSLRENRTGAWSDINAGARPERRTRRRQTLWLDHGTDPADARYAYALLPGAARDEVAHRAAGPRWLRVLADDASRRAVVAPSLGLTAAAFWWSGSAGGLTVSRPAAVLLRRQGRTGTLSVSDPTRTGEPQELEWGRPVRKVPDHPDAVEILPTGPRPRLSVTRGEACATRV
ncbi:polysaccharide lyase beta-sandwich domain-containing protein [Streptomyces griseoincarnatus]